jgi:hypothetical protein
MSVNDMPPTGPPDPNGQADLAGYPSVEALVQGYRASGEEARKLRERTQQVEQQYQALSQAVANPRPDVPQRQSASQQLSDFGIPTDALDAFVGERLQQAFQPITRGFEARGKVLGEYPDYARYESDVSQFVANDPTVNARYQAMFNVDPAGAMEYAYLKFGDSRRKTIPSQTQGSREQAVEASIPGSRQGGSPSPANAENDMLARAWDHYKKTNDPVAYAKARLRQVVPDEFLNQ